MSSSAASLQFTVDPPPPPLAVPTDAVDVWQMNLDQVSENTLSQMRPWLSADEAARVDRLLPALTKRRTLAMRGLLRWLLAGYLRLPPEVVVFSYADHGKPLVVGRDGVTHLRFNVSHSQEMGLVAVAACEVGIDVEKLRDNIAMAPLVERYFSAHEKERFRALAHPIGLPIDQPDAPARDGLEAREGSTHHPSLARRAGGEESNNAVSAVEAQRAWFFRCWTRKEALLKACGLGIHLPLDQVEVSGEEGEIITALQGSDWRLLDISQGEWMAALAVPATVSMDVRWGVLSVQDQIA